MLSLSSLLNPISTPDARKATEQDTASSYYANLIQSAPRIPLQEFPPKPKMSKDGAVFSKGKIKGRVEYSPFERLDKDSLRAVRKFKVFPFGDIAKYPRHIPYNSEKKSFLEKTGRESFEVFQYTFQLPDDEKEYTVMWDYNVGLVRITPFFKCCKYSKTSPAKMLNLNPGLKDITHSITGGALAAQGYWMPYTCARAICATFCAHIAGALIPIFGPNFQQMCIPRDSPDYGKHVIDSAIVKRATEEAKDLRKSLPPSDSVVDSGSSSDPFARQMQMQQQHRARGLPIHSPSTRCGGRESVSPRSVPSDFSLSRGEQRSNGKKIRILRTNGQIEYAASHTDTDSESGFGYSNRPHYRKDREGIETPMTSPALSYTSSVNGWTPCNIRERMHQNTNAFSCNTNSSPRVTRVGDREYFGALRELKQYAISTHTPSATPTASPWLSAVPRDGCEGMDLRIKLPPMLSPPRSETSTGERERVRIPPIGLGIRNVALTPQHSPARRNGAEIHKRGREDEKSDTDHEYDADSDASFSSGGQRAGKRRMNSRDLGHRRQIAREAGRTPLPDIAPEGLGRRENRRGHFEEHEKNAAVLALLSLSSEDRKDELGGVLMKRKRCASL